jgi:membrane protease subunit (stomatin/prohibitin family)
MAIGWQKAGQFVKAGVQEMMIARPESAGQLVIYKHPDRTVPKFAQLTVRADEACVFFRDGRVVGTLRGGRHTLDSANIPFLGMLVDKVTGGNVFIAELFFVATREIPDMKFGGRIGELEDPKTGLVAETMVHGSFAYRVMDPERLIVNLAGMHGSENEAFEKWFKQQVLKVIRDRCAELIVKKDWPLLKVTSGAYTEEIEVEVLRSMAPHVAQYGIQVQRMGNFVLAIDEDAKKEIREFSKKMAFIRGAGGMQGYQQFAMAEAMMGAGKGMAQGGGSGGGNMMMGGAALGVGFGMAGMFQQQAVQAQQQMAAPRGYPPQGYAPQPYPPQGYPQAAPVAGAAVMGAAGSPAETTTCAGCGGAVPAASRFCPGCGSAIAVAQPQATAAACSGCGQPLTPGARFCAGCGAPAP